jgi:hypothetical protein
VECGWQPQAMVRRGPLQYYTVVDMWA